MKKIKGNILVGESSQCCEITNSEKEIDIRTVFERIDVYITNLINEVYYTSKGMNYMSIYEIMSKKALYEELYAFGIVDESLSAEKTNRLLDILYLIYIDNDLTIIEIAYELESLISTGRFDLLPDERFKEQKEVISEILGIPYIKENKKEKKECE